MEIGQESSLLKDSVDSYKDIIKKLRSEHRILKTNSASEISRYKAEVEILKERVEILESTDSSRMLEEQLKLEKTAHSSNILALKTKMENQGKEIEKLISNQETIKELYESEKTAASELVEEKLRDKNEMAKKLESVQTELGEKDIELERLRERFWEATTSIHKIRRPRKSN